MTNTHGSAMVDRRELKAALNTLGRTASDPRGLEVTLKCESGLLELRLGGVSAQIPAEGGWVGVVVLAPSFARLAGRALPKESRIALKIEGDRFHCGSLSVPCRWELPAGRDVWLPINASIGELLRIRLKHSDQELRERGALEVVKLGAEEAERLIEHAGRTLATFGIQESQIRELAHRSVLGG